MTSFEIHRLETCEMAAWEDLFKAVPGDLALEADIHLEDCDEGLVGIVGSADVLALNRVVGLGIRKDAAADSALRLIERYDGHAVSRFFVPVAPVAQPDSLRTNLERYGLRGYNNWIRLVRDANPPPGGPTGLEIRRIDGAMSLPFGTIVCRNFGWPEHLNRWFGATVGRPNWLHYMAFDGGNPVAAAAAFVRGHCAWFGFAVTDETHRGRGAQNALLAGRLRDVRTAGCNLITLETAEPKGGVPAPSYRNAIRQGFSVAYTRPNFIWERAPETG